jgi:hypothetical protein
LKENQFGIAPGVDMNINQYIKTSQFYLIFLNSVYKKNKLKSLLIIILFIASCTIIETAVESTKRIGEAVIDETVDLGKTIISIPVDATKTIVDKIDEELHESDDVEEAPTVIQEEEEKEIINNESTYTSLYGLALAFMCAIFFYIGLKSK